MTRKIVRGKHVISNPETVSADGTLADGALLVEDGRVVEVLPYSALKAKCPDAPVVGSDRHVVMPGLVNAHHHGRGLMGLQLGILDDYLEVWLLDYWRQRPLEVYLDTLYGNIRLLRAGVTTTIHSGYSRDWSETATEARDTLRAHVDSGMRVAYALGVEDQNTFVLQDNETFLGSLPADLGARAREVLYRLGPSEGYDYFELFEELAGAYDGHPRIRLLYGPTGPEWCSPELMGKIAERAKSVGAGVHMHCLESPLEHDFSFRCYGKSSLAHLRDLGILGERTSLAHATWMSEEDMKICADHGASVCHNASSNLRLHNGVAPVARMLELGVNVAIGIDGWGINNDDDMLQEMRLVSCLHRMPRRMRAMTAPSAADVLRMATLGGARPSCFGDGIGRLTPGAEADAVLLDLDALGRPYLDPRTPVWEAIVGLANARQVDIVMVGGEVLVEGGRYLQHDEEKLLEELSRVAEQALPEHLSQFHGVVEDLKPYVRKFYDDWPAAAATDPIYTPNSRI